MIRGNAPYVALAATVGVPCGFAFAALVPAVAVALLATNVALWVAYRLWGGDAADV